MKLVALTLGACRLVPEPVANALHTLTSCFLELANVVGSVLHLKKFEVVGLVEFLFEPASSVAVAALSPHLSTVLVFSLGKPGYLCMESLLHKVCVIMCLPKELPTMLEHSLGWVCSLGEWRFR